MSNRILFRRGPDAGRGTVILDSGEPGWTTDTKKLYVGDGATYGGILVSGAGGGDLCDLDDVNCAGTVNDKVLTFSSGTWIPQTPGGGGDMLKSVYVEGVGTVYNASRLGGDTLATVQAHNVAASKITSGTIGLARIPAVDDARIPDLETLSYGAAFATAQIPNLPTTKITSGSFNAGRIPILPTSRITTGTFNLNRIPSVDDARIPDLETLSYGGAFAGAQIPSLVASKITTGTFNANRIPILPTDRYGSAVLVTGVRSLTGDLDFAKHQAKAIALEALGSAPASPATAQMYYNTGDDKVYVYVA